MQCPQTFPTDVNGFIRKTCVPSPARIAYNAPAREGTLEAPWRVAGAALGRVAMQAKLVRAGKAALS
jgi:hypothetical protein